MVQWGLAVTSGLSTLLANLCSARLHDRSNLGTMWIYGSRGKSTSGRRSRRPAPRRPPKSSLLTLVARPRVWIMRAWSDLLARAIRTTVVDAAAAQRVGCPRITSHATPAAWSTRGPERAQKHLDRATARPAHLSLRPAPALDAPVPIIGPPASRVVVVMTIADPRAVLPYRGAGALGPASPERKPVARRWGASSARGEHLRAGLPKDGVLTRIWWHSRRTEPRCLLVSRV